MRHAEFDRMGSCGLPRNSKVDLPGGNIQQLGWLATYVYFRAAE
jgi:hypothetical protein